MSRVCIGKRFRNDFWGLKGKSDSKIEKFKWVDIVWFVAIKDIQFSYPLNLIKNLYKKDFPAKNWKAM